MPDILTGDGNMPDFDHLQTVGVEMPKRLLTIGSLTRAESGSVSKEIIIYLQSCAA
jgi:hypothetical protein